MFLFNLPLHNVSCHDRPSLRTCAWLPHHNLPISCPTLLQYRQHHNPDWRPLLSLSHRDRTRRMPIWKEVKECVKNGMEKTSSHEKNLQWSLRGIWIFDVFSFFPPSDNSSFRWDITLHFSVIALLVFFGHLVEALLFFVEHCLQKKELF